MTVVYTYLLLLPGVLVEPLQMMDGAAASSVTCSLLELLDPSLICQSCVRTSLFSPVALTSPRTHAVVQHNRHKNHTVKKVSCYNLSNWHDIADMTTSRPCWIIHVGSVFLNASLTSCAFRCITVFMARHRATYKTSFSLMLKYHCAINRVSIHLLLWCQQHLET